MGKIFSYTEQQGGIVAAAAGKAKLYTEEWGGGKGSDSWDTVSTRGGQRGTSVALAGIEQWDAQSETRKCATAAGESQSKGRR